MLDVALLIVCWVIAIALSIPAFFFSLTVLRACIPKAHIGNAYSDELPDRVRPDVLRLLMPAHNEAILIADTLSHLIAHHVADPSQIIVIADNCSDNTASIAAGFGVRVLERWDPERLGKGFALDFGLRSLAEDPPHCIAVVDADCQLSPGSLKILSDLSVNCRCVAQAFYYLALPSNSQPLQRVSWLAFLVKNLRSLGLSRMGMPCNLKGTGFVVQWEAIRKVNVATADIVEDLRIGIELLELGYPTRFEPRAMVSSPMASDRRAAISQSKRWEHGHLLTSIAVTPRLALRSLQRWNLPMACFALHLAIPPLALFLILMLLGVSILGIAVIWIPTAWQPFLVSLWAYFLITIAITVSWWLYARNEVTVFHLLFAPFYILQKIPIYLSLATGKKSTWTRTER